MFTSISWKTYLTAIIVLAVIYYLIIAILYYRKDIQKRVSGYSGPKLRKRPPAATSEEDANVTAFASQEKRNNDDVLLPATYELKRELKELFEKAAANSYPVSELLRSIQLLLRNYPHLQDTAFQYAINNYIKSEIKELSDILIPDADLAKAWLG